LKRRPDVVLRFRPQPALRPRALRGFRSQRLELQLLERFTDARHYAPPSVSPTRSARKLAPCASGPTPKFAAIVWPRSAKVARVPRSRPSGTPSPATSSGTYSGDWPVLGTV